MGATGKLPSILAVARALGFEVAERGEPGVGWMRCPAVAHEHDRDQPGCQLREAQGVFKCFKCPDVHGDVVGLVKLVKECEAGAAFKWLRETFGSGVGTPAARIDAGVDPIGALAERRGWGVEALRAMGCVGNGRSVEFPMRNVAGEVTGWRIRRGDGSAYDGGQKALTRRGSKNGVLGVWPVPGEGVVIITEGEADAAAVLAAGWPAVLATPGATPGRAVEEALQRLLAGRKVILTPDPDRAGEAWRKRIGGELAAAGCKVSFIAPMDGDIDKRLRGVSDRAAELARLIEMAIPLPGGEPGGDGESGAGGGESSGAGDGAKRGGGAGEAQAAEDECVVRIGPDEARVTDEVVKILIDREKDLYERADMLVTVQRAEREGGMKRFGGMSIVMVSPAWVRDRITRHCRLKAIEARTRKYVWAHPPAWLAGSVVSRTYWPGMPELVGVAGYPILGKKGVVIMGGYDAETGWLVRPAMRVEGYVARPGPEDVAAARAALHEVVIDYPFAHPAGESAWVSMVLSVLARPSIEGPVPLFLGDASVRGAGKTKILELASIIATGHKPTTMPESKDEEEEKKRIFSTLLAGDSVNLVDDVTRVGGAAMNMLLTNYPLYSDRVLGQSANKKLPNLGIWCMSGNNPEIMGDVRRRVLPIRLEPKVERPEDRKGFRHPDLVRWVAAEQPRLMGAALTLLAAWHEAGRPELGDECRPWGSYEAWSGVVRACLVWCGYPDPYLVCDGMGVTDDPDVAVLGALLDKLAMMGAEMTAGEIIEEISEGRWTGDVADGVKEIATGSRGMSARALGKRLRKWNRRVSRGMYLEQRMGMGGIFRYRACEVVEADVKYMSGFGVEKSGFGGGRVGFENSKPTQNRERKPHEISAAENESGFSGFDGDTTRAQAHTRVNARARGDAAAGETNPLNPTNPLVDGSGGGDGVRMPPMMREAVVFRDWLAGRGVGVELDERGLLCVYGHLGADGEREMDRLREALIRVLEREKGLGDGLPF